MKLLNTSRGDPWTLGKDRRQIVTGTPWGDRWYVHYAHGRAYCSLLTNEFSRGSESLWASFWW